jgi:hypothetical protein
MSRFALLDAPALDLLRHADGLTKPGVERLQGIDRALRALEGSEGFGREAKAGWAISGSVALLGVWIRSEQTLRIPRTLSLAPIDRRERWPAERIATLIALGLPGGVPETRDGKTEIRYEGTYGEARLPLLFERAPLHLAPPRELTGAELVANGYIWDRRMSYRSRVATDPVVLPTALPNELILRLLASIAAAPDSGEIADEVDDLRLLLAREARDVITAAKTSVRAALYEAFAARPGTSIAAARSALVETGRRLGSAIERSARPEAIGEDERGSAGFYEPGEREALLRSARELTVAIAEGR